MKAELLVRERLAISENVFVHTVIWRVPQPVRGSDHPFKYSLALIADGLCVLRYDNEAGKGDHKHILDQQVSYPFMGVERLKRDFLADVTAWRKQR